MTSSLIPEVPGFDEPLEMLVACHGRIAQQCTTLEKLVGHLARHGTDDRARQAAAAVMRYFDSAGRHHHEDEESDLFPALLAVGREGNSPGLVAAIEALRSDHRQMETAWQGLRNALADIAAGMPTALDPTEVAAFTALYRNHIAREEGEVFAVAHSLLDVETLERLGNRMAARRQVTPQKP